MVSNGFCVEGGSGFIVFLLGIEIFIGGVIIGEGGFKRIGYIA